MAWRMAAYWVSHFFALPLLFIFDRLSKPVYQSKYMSPTLGLCLLSLWSISCSCISNFVLCFSALCITCRTVIIFWYRFFIWLIILIPKVDALAFYETRKCTYSVSPKLLHHFLPVPKETCAHFIHMYLLGASLYYVISQRLGAVECYNSGETGEVCIFPKGQ